MINTLGMASILLCDNTDFLIFLLHEALISEPVLIWFFNACDFKNTAVFLLSNFGSMRLSFIHCSFVHSVVTDEQLYVMKIPF